MARSNFFTRGLFVQFIFILTVVSSIGFTGVPAWQKISSGFHETGVSCAAVHSKNRQILFAGTERGLYRSEDGGKSFHTVLTPRGSRTGVNYIYITEAEPAAVYAATDSGLFLSLDSGIQWEKIYETSDELERRVMSVAENEDALFIGTLHGMFFRKPFTGQWERVRGELGTAAVFHLRQAGRSIYASTGGRLFEYDTKTDTCRKIFTCGTSENEEDFMSEETDPSLMVSARKIRDFQIIPVRPFQIYLAAQNGIFFSLDAGRAWQRMPGDGITSDQVSSLLVWEEAEGPVLGFAKQSRIRLAAGSERGVFIFQDNRWRPLYKGLDTNGIYGLIRGKGGRVYASTESGLYVIEPVLDASPRGPIDHEAAGLSWKMIEERFENEPDIRAVQDLAIEYAEVHPDKIKNWRKLARAKAFMPDISLGLNRADTELYHWDTGQNPDELQKGTEYLDWSLTASWDFADLIWSSDQTSIDSRSKLMVELREDILDQVTRLYFERRRAQIELLSLQPADGGLPNTAPDQPSIFDKQLRVQELTALIDGLTGGEFSKLVTDQSSVISEQDWEIE